jgi:GH25 family lysozyme M1 (1,4-beta-N-acetylmuramidase)
MKILDVYSQNRFDFLTEKQNGVIGIIFKGGQGEWPDVPRVHPEWFAQCEAAGLAWGVYWLVDGRYSPERHKAAIYRMFPNGFGKLGLWLDCEKPVLSMTEADYRKLPYAFHPPIESIARGVERECGKLPGIYTSPGAWRLIFGGAPADIQKWFATMPLWTAQYKTSRPDLYGAWERWTFWQYQESPDYSIYNGTDDELLRFIESGQPQPPITQQEGAKMYTGKVNINGLRIRAGAGTQFEILGSLMAGDIVEADIKSAQWWRLTKVTRGGAVITLPGVENWASGDYITQTSGTQPAADDTVHIEFNISNGKVFASANGRAAVEL